MAEHPRAAHAGYVMEPVEEVSHRLPLDERLSAHRVIWRLQPVLLAVLVLGAAGSLSGLFSEGWLSSTTVGDARNEATYERFVRYGKEAVVEARLAGPSPLVSIPLDYLGHFKLDRVVPEPASVRVDGDMLHQSFDSAGPVVVRFYLMPVDPGSASSVWTLDGTEVRLRHLTYP